MKVYITKWALTKGILVANAEPLEGSREHVVVKGAVPWQDFKFGLGDWHVDPEKAEKRAVTLRDKKAEQLEGQAKKLRELTFPVPML